MLIFQLFNILNYLFLFLKLVLHFPLMGNSILLKHDIVKVMRVIPMQKWVLYGLTWHGRVISLSLTEAEALLSTQTVYGGIAAT